MARTLWSYSRLRAVRPAEVRIARSVPDLAATLGHAERHGRRVTIRAGGRSFDDHALGDDIVLDLRSLDRILASGDDEVKVEAGATWGAIVDATLERGLLPHVLVTTGGATAGGTLASNCLSRSTPRHGHTGDHVRSLSLLTVSGDTLTCSREQNGDLFRAVIGGLGVFGVVIEATYDLQFIGARRHVETVIDRVEDLAPFTERLIELSASADAYDAVYSVFSLARPQRGAVLRSTYTTESRGKVIHLYEPRAWYRPIAELLFLSSRVSNALSHASYRHVFRQGAFISPLRDYTFCMEANERARTMTERVGLKMRSLQASYIVPEEGLLFFLRETARIFDAHDVYPSLLDCLYAPANDFLLSASNGLAGFCVTFTFAGMRRSPYQRIRRAILQLNDVCIDVGGRINLVKDVHASRSQVRRMFGHAFVQLAELKERHDPKHVLVNGLFERLFGGPAA